MIAYLFPVIVSMKNMSSHGDNPSVWVKIFLVSVSVSNFSLTWMFFKLKSVCMCALSKRVDANLLQKLEVRWGWKRVLPDRCQKRKQGKELAYL